MTGLTGLIGYRLSQPTIAKSGSELGELLILILLGVLSMAITFVGVVFNDPILLAAGIIISGLTISLMAVKLILLLVKLILLVVKLISAVVKLKIDLMDLRERRRKTKPPPVANSDR